MTTYVPPALVDGILVGNILAQVVPAMSVRTVGLSVIRNQKEEAIPDQSLAIGAAPGVGLVRCDMVQWDGTTINVKAGTAAALAAVNSPTPDAGFMPLALVLIFNGDTTIRNMGTLDSSSSSKGRIYCYYYARRGFYAASQSAQDVVATGTDPEVFLPVYHPRGSVVRIKFSSNAAQSGAGFNGVQISISLDGTIITRSTNMQQYNQSPLGSPESSNEVGVASEMPRAGVAAGVHRWTATNTPRDGADQSLQYRFMELVEIM